MACQDEAYEFIEATSKVLTQYQTPIIMWALEDIEKEELKTPKQVKDAKENGKSTNNANTNEFDIKAPSITDDMVSTAFDSTTTVHLKLTHHTLINRF